MNRLTLTLLWAILMVFSICSDSPFIKTGSIYEAHSQFQLNLILNQNRNLPILVFVYSIDKTKQVTENILTQAFNFESDIGFGLLIDCRNFQLSLNGTLAICVDYKTNLKKGLIIQQDIENGIDNYFQVIFMAPSSMKIKEKGHTILKQHTTLNKNPKDVTSNSISKFIQRQLPDFITTIQDNNDLNDFLKLQSDFSISKQPKLIHFDANLLSPPFLKKLGAKLYNTINVATCDDPNIAKKLGVQLQDTILLQYNFQTNSYDTRKLIINSIDHPVRQIQQQIRDYLQLRRSRDILLDFQLRESIVYNFSNTKIINHLFSYGRVIVLQISKQEDKYICPALYQILKSQGTLFNYICLHKSAVTSLAKAVPQVQQSDFSEKILWLDGSIRKYKILSQPFDQIWKNLKRADSRQKVSNYMQSQLCIRNANAQGKLAVFYYFNQKTNQQQIAITQYLNSLPEVNSLIYFCKIYLPDKQISKKLEIAQNSLFSLISSSQSDNLKKLQNRNAEGFNQIKMFVRQNGIQKMTKAYQERFMNNKIPQINSAKQLTKYCYNKICVIGIIARGNFREENQIEILKKAKLQNSQQGLEFVIIDGFCHFEIPKQLKILGKNDKVIDRSYIIAYRQKDSKYQLWKNSVKSWDEKDINKWIKTLKDEKNMKRMKFGLDVQQKTCQQQGIYMDVKGKSKGKDNAQQEQL